MKYFLIIVVLVITAFVYYWWSNIDQTISKEEVSTMIDDSISTTTVTKTIPSEESNQQTYRNDEWGITFNYPNDWVIRQPAFGSTVSKLNFSVEPKEGRKYPETILFNITPKLWIENAMVKMKKDGIVFSDTEVSGLKAIRFESSYEGMPQIDYLILVNNTYWINVAGKKEYEETLNQVLASLVITPVEIPVSNQ